MLPPVWKHFNAFRRKSQRAIPIWSDFRLLQRQRRAGRIFLPKIHIFLFYLSPIPATIEYCKFVVGGLHGGSITGETSAREREGVRAVHAAGRSGAARRPRTGAHGGAGARAHGKRLGKPPGRERGQDDKADHSLERVYLFQHAVLPAGAVRDRSRLHRAEAASKPHVHGRHHREHGHRHRAGAALEKDAGKAQRPRGAAGTGHPRRRASPARRTRSRSAPGTSSCPAASSSTASAARGSPRSARTPTSRGSRWRPSAQSPRASPK